MTLINFLYFPPPSLFFCLYLFHCYCSSFSSFLLLNQKLTTIQKVNLGTIVRTTVFSVMEHANNFLLRHTSVQSDLLEISSRDIHDCFKVLKLYIFYGSLFNLIEKKNKKINSWFSLKNHLLFFAWSTLMEQNLTQKNVWISETMKYFPKNFCSNRKEFKIRKTTFSNVIFSHVFRNYNISRLGRGRGLNTTP